jgi:Flp pilus assembly protein TadD
MSLLLDALKKAAQEKQNADSAVIKADDDVGVGLELEPDQPPYVQGITEAGSDDGAQHEELELVLDDAEPVQEYEPPVEPSPAYEQTQHSSAGNHRITPTPSTVSDEALQLLIHKTNEEHRKSRRKLWGGVALGSIVLLSISGLYFYKSMVVEIESMQRKHEIALATLKSKTRIEENLTSLAAVPEAEPEPSSVRSEAPIQTMKSAPDDAVDRSSKETFSVQRGDKKNPVSESLQRGWRAFQNKEYELSGQEYRKVLEKEPFNHDALLGMAAVSLQEGDFVAARDMYITLLERDPRDPHAHAGLANIAQSSGASLSESRLKQLIEYRPDDAHLQFALGNLYVQKKSWPEAQQAFFNAWKTDNTNPDYAYNLAVSLDQLGKHEQARIYYQDSLKLATGKNISFSPDAVKSRLAYLGNLQ